MADLSDDFLIMFPGIHDEEPLVLAPLAPIAEQSANFLDLFAPDTVQDAVRSGVSRERHKTEFSAPKDRCKWESRCLTATMREIKARNDKLASAERANAVADIANRRLAMSADRRGHIVKAVTSVGQTLEWLDEFAMLPFYNISFPHPATCPPPTPNKNKME